MSPELFFDWTPSGTLTTRPMKGTAPRVAEPDADAAGATALCHSAKERAENIMIVDLLRNDLARVAVVGSAYSTSLTPAVAQAFFRPSSIVARTSPRLAASAK